MINLFLKNEELYLTQQANKVLRFSHRINNIHYINVTENNDGYRLYHSKLISIFNMLSFFAESDL